MLKFPTTAHAHFPHRCACSQSCLIVYSGTTLFWMPMNEGKCHCYSEVSSFQRLKCIQEWYLKEVSSLHRVWNRRVALTVYTVLVRTSVDKCHNFYSVCVCVCHQTCGCTSGECDLHGSSPLPSPLPPSLHQHHQ